MGIEAISGTKGYFSSPIGAIGSGQEASSVRLRNQGDDQNTAASAGGFVNSIFAQ